MVPEGSFPCLQEPATPDPNPEATESSLFNHILFL
jgi:hypothetical protein